MHILPVLYWKLARHLAVPAYKAAPVPIWSVQALCGHMGLILPLLVWGPGMNQSCLRRPTGISPISDFVLLKLCYYHLGCYDFVPWFTAALLQLCAMSQVHACKGLSEVRPSPRLIASLLHLIK